MEKEYLLKLAQKKEEELTKEDKEYLSKLEDDDRRLEFLIMINISFIKYLTLTNDSDISSGIINKSSLLSIKKYFEKNINEMNQHNIKSEIELIYAFLFETEENKEYQELYEDFSFELEFEEIEKNDSIITKEISGLIEYIPYRTIIKLLDNEIKLPIITENIKKIEEIMKEGYIWILDYINPNLITKEMVHFVLEKKVLDNVIIEKIKKIIYNDKDLLKTAIKNKFTLFIDKSNPKILTPELIKLAIDNGYIIHSKSPNIIKNNIEIIKYAIENKQPGVINIINKELLNDELVYKAIDNGYSYLQTNTRKELKEEKYILYAINKGQTNIVYYLNKDEITEKIVIESLKKYLGEEEYNKEKQELLEYVNLVTNKKFKNIEEFIHKNELLYQMIFELAKKRIPRYMSINTNINDRLNHERNDFETAYNKFKELIKITRIMGMNLDFDSLQKMDESLIKQYKSKIWKKLQTHRMFSRDENTKKALIEMIGVFGLFDNDKLQSDIRLDILNKLINKVPSRFTKEEYKMIFYINKDAKTVEKDVENFEELFKKVPGKKYKFKHEEIELPGLLNKYEEFFEEELDEKQYQFLKKLLPTGRTGSALNKYLKTAYEEIEEEYYEIDTTKLNKDNINKLTTIILQVDLLGELTFNSIHRMFDGMKQVYNEEFFNFLIENFDMLLLDKIHQSDLKQIQQEFEIIKEKNNQAQLTYSFVMDYLETIEFEHVKKGNETLAQQVHEAGANSQNAFEYYQNLYEIAKTIKFTSLPNYEQEFELEYKGKLTKFRARRLRKNDPLLLLVGEAHNTNCCQIYDNAGQECNKHSAQSQDGGVFVTEMLKGGKWVLLTQSWDWVNDKVYCHDNVEGTDLFKETPELKDIVATLYKKHAEAILEISKKTTEEYLNEHENLSPVQLQVIKNQILEMVTVGYNGCDDLGVPNYFDQEVKKTIGPKNYRGYRDSQTQYIISGKEIIKEINMKSWIELQRQAIKENYISEGIYLYREQRQIKTECSENITSYTLNLIDEIENELKIPEENKLIKTDYNEELDNYSQTLKNNTIIISGEDWFISYEENDTIEINNIEKSKPRLEDEMEIQNHEIINTIKQLITENKKIKLDLNEQTISIYKELIKEDLVFEENNNTITITNPNYNQTKTI